MKLNLKRPDYSGQKAMLTITEFRQAPGKAIDFVEYGGEITVTRSGRIVACLAPPDTTIYPDGSWTGKRPLMMGIKA